MIDPANYGSHCKLFQGHFNGRIPINQIDSLSDLTRCLCDSFKLPFEFSFWTLSNGTKLLHISLNESKTKSSLCKILSVKIKGNNRAQQYFHFLSFLTNIWLRWCSYYSNARFKRFQIVRKPFNSKMIMILSTMENAQPAAHHARWYSLVGVAFLDKS